MNLVVSVSRQPEWKFVFKKIEDKYGWVPKYWITYEENHQDITQAFPEAITHSRLEISRGIPEKTLEHLMYDSLNEKELFALDSFLPTALEIIDRVDLDTSLSFSQRIRLIHKMYAYWGNIINLFNIDCAVFNVSPHSLGDYILYATMKIRDKKTIFFQGTPVNNIHFLCTDIDKLPDNLILTYKKILNEEISVELAEPVLNSISIIKSARSDYKPWYVSDANIRDKKHQNIVDLIQNNIHRKLRYTLRFDPKKPIFIGGSNGYKNICDENAEPVRKKRSKNVDRELPRLFKVPGRPLQSKMITLREYQDYRDWALTRKIELREEYAKICEPAPRGREFVYFAMHYQPERTTCPDGGIFSNQYLCVALLSKALGDNVKIVIKEHPTQFSYTGMGELARWSGYYDDFLRLGNVHFVSSDISSVELIDKSVAVATVTGAVGWEALVRGKPVLHFGSAWYGACRGAYRVKSEEHIKSAIDEILDGTQHSEKDILSYAKALQYIGEIAYTTPTVEKGVKMDGDLGLILLKLIENHEYCKNLIK